MIMVFSLFLFVDRVFAYANGIAFLVTFFLLKKKVTKEKALKGD